LAKHPDLDDGDNSAKATALAAWTAVLDTLETAVQTAESTLQDPRDNQPARPNGIRAVSQKSWVPPALTTPLPPELRARAMDLAASQESLTKRLEESRLNAARQLQAVLSVPGIGEPPKAVYLDVKG
jgi:hypothetical protein